MRLGPWSRRRREEELEEELRSHFRMAVEERLERGESLEEAEAAVRREFGNVILVKEVTRQMWGWIWLEQLLQDIRYGLRMLWKKPGFTLTAILTLSLGIGANTAIFTVVDAVLLRPLPYPDSERLMQVGRSFRSGEVAALSEPKFVFLRDNIQSFEAVTATQGLTARLAGEGQTEYFSGLMVTADFFRVMGIHPAVGRGFTSQEDSPGGNAVAILGDGLWRSRFGADAGIIGKTIILNDVSRTIIGVTPPGFEYFGSQDIFVPMAANPASRNEGHNWTVIGRLKHGVTQEQARAELKQLFEKFETAYPRQVQQNETFSAANWRVSMTSGVRELLWILLGTVSFVLLIACANVANLQLTRAAARKREMAIRLALGASRARLLRQLLTESVLLSLLGGLTGLLLANWGLSAMLALAPEGLIPRSSEINLDWRVLAFAVAASLVTGIIFGLAPALQALRLDVNRAVKEATDKTSAGVGRARLRNVLVVAEVALALALTVGAGLLLRTFANLRGVEPGFDAHNLLTVEVSLRGKNYDTVAKANDFYKRALERFNSLPGVEAAALTNKLPLDAQFNLPYRLAGQTELGGAVQYRLISPDYFRVMKMAVRQGRAFGEGDTAEAEPVLIVNEAFARRAFGEAPPLDQRLCVACEYGDPAMRRVVGVVNETKQRSLSEAAPATVFIPAAQAADGVKGVLQQSTFVLRSQGEPLLLSAVVRDELRRIDAGVPVRNLRSMEQLVSRSVGPQRFNLSLLGLFAALGLLLAAIGIYGVMAYGVAQRTREIGIRMALGAQGRDVLRLIIRQGMALVFGGVVLGLVASFGLTRLMASLLFGVTAHDPMTFAGVTLLLVTVALIACLIPARRATMVDPMVALRDE